MFSSRYEGVTSPKRDKDKVSLSLKSTSLRLIMLLCEKCPQTSLYISVCNKPVGLFCSDVFTVGNDRLSSVIGHLQNHPQTSLFLQREPVKTGNFCQIFYFKNSILILYNLSDRLQYTTGNVGGSVAFSVCFGFFLLQMRRNGLFYRCDDGSSLSEQHQRKEQKLDLNYLETILPYNILLVVICPYFVLKICIRHQASGSVSEVDPLAVKFASPPNEHFTLFYIKPLNGCV